jgi:hypothetical protein
MSDLIRAEEKKSHDEAPYSRPVIREDAQGQPLMVDPTSYLLTQGEENSVEVEYHKEILELEPGETAMFYNSKTTVFVDPCTALALDTTASQSGACIGLKLSMPGLYRAATDRCRGLLSLLNRIRSKPVFIEKLQEALVGSELSLIDASRIFMRMNSVYK